MAPSRRKGAGKAAAAAAARRQWKVGDLVLAKVKGFPAWPATVSEPEKWGYSADWKKVMVYFFGTQQIAFCNPADVEAFTEEKKQSLLIKRQGKGADFVRAVQEIIASYEKSKKQEQVDDSKSADEVTPANGENSTGSLQDSAEASGATLDSQSKASDSVKAGNDTSLPIEHASAAAQIVVALRENNTACEQPADSMVVKETPALTTYSSRKRSGGLRSQKSVMLRKAPTTRRSRSSSRVESYGFQSFMTQCNDGGQSAGDISANVIWDGSLRRNKRMRKSPVASEWDGVDSSAFISIGSVEDNDSEIATVDSDNVSLNEGSAIDSDCKLEHSDSVVECLEGDVELSKGIDFQIKAVVIKKKRKPNRKRVTNEATEPPARMGVVADLEVRVHNTCQNSQNSCKVLNERFSEENGDEHLPLVKRARVRMSKPSSTEEEVNTSSQAEEKPLKEVAVNMSRLISPSSFCDDDGRAEGDSFAATGALDNISSPKVTTQILGDIPADLDSFVDKRALVNVSPSKPCTQNLENGPQLWKVAKNQFGRSPDGEAALPPSKRLHRAMEAMSANASEGQACAEVSSNMKMLINDSCVPSTRSSHMTNESKEGNALELDCVDSLGNNTGFCSSSNPIISEESTKSSAEEGICKQSIECSKSQKHEPCKDVFVGPTDCIKGNDSSGSAFDVCAIQTAVQIQIPKRLSPNPLSPLKDKSNTRNSELIIIGAENRGKELDSSEHTKMSLNTSNEIVSNQDGADVLQYNAEHIDCKDTESLKRQIDDNSQVNSMCEVVEEVKSEQTQKNTNSVSISDEHSCEKLSPSPADVVDSPARGSPSSISVRHISTAESANIILNNDCCGPNVCLLDKKTVCAMAVDEEGKNDTSVAQRSKSVGKWSNYAEAHAALSSFELMIATLTRTKESIGRATRMAIDCAKFGVSAKVVEILARNLEIEPSIRRRVDLFFLVDSITQCSRGLKGDGGIYPSAIQAMLPRLLSAAAPPGTLAQENRRQCLKVLRLWLERRILPESIIRQHVRELDSLSSSTSGGAFSRRSARTERALDDPIRDMEGMLVDEYGSNSTFQLPGFCMPRMLKDEDEGSDSDGGSFEAVTPEHNSETPEEREATSAIERHRHILEDVDGELEMEDVAPSREVEMSSSTNVAGVNTAQTSYGQFEQQFPLPLAPPLPQDVRPSSPPLPSSPPPPPPPPPLPPPCAISDSYPNGVDSKTYPSMHEDLRHSAGQTSVAPRISPVTSTNAVHYQGPDCRDLQMPNQISDATSSFSSFPAHSMNNVQRTDGPSFRHKPYPPRPPNPALSNQFSYIQAGQHVKSRREAPPPSYHRSHFVPNFDHGNFFDNHERMKPAPYESRESWRFSSPSFPGPRYPDKTKASYVPGSYAAPSCELARFPNQRWDFPPRPMNHRNSFPTRQPSEDAVPVGMRAPSIWQPR